MANPFPFVAGEVLTAADMNGIGETTSFTPTWTNLTVGNGTLNWATYVRVQNLVFVQVQFTLGSTSAVTGNIYFNAPVSSSVGTQNNIGNAIFADANVNVTFTGVASMATNLIQAIPINVSSTVGFYQNASSTFPFTWATNDVVGVFAVYRVA